MQEIPPVSTVLDQSRRIRCEGQIGVEMDAEKIHWNLLARQVAREEPKAANGFNVYIARPVEHQASN